MAQHETLAGALAAFQAELPKLRKDESAKVRGESKDGQVVNYTYGYADLAQVVEVVSPILGKHGLAFTSMPTMTSDRFVLEYTLLHESGERLSGIWPLPNPTQIKPQLLGSAITYARRYALMAVTNTFPDAEDDDGAKAGEVPSSYTAPREERPARQQRQSRTSTRTQTDAEVIDRLGQKQGQPATPADKPAEKPAGTRARTDAEIVEQCKKFDNLDLKQSEKLYAWMVHQGFQDRQVGTSNGVPFAPSNAFADRLAYLAETADRAGLGAIRAVAENYSVIDFPVSETQTLSAVLDTMRALRNAEALEDNPHAKDLQQAAADSWGEPPGDTGD